MNNKKNLKKYLSTNFIYYNDDCNILTFDPFQGIIEYKFYKFPFFTLYQYWEDIKISENNIKILINNKGVVLIVQKFSKNKKDSGTNNKYLLYRPHFYEINNYNKNQKIDHTYEKKGSINLKIEDENNKVIYDGNYQWHIHENKLSESEPQIKFPFEIEYLDNYYLVNHTNDKGTFEFIFYLIGDEVKTERGKQNLKKYFNN